MSSVERIETEPLSYSGALVACGLRAGAHTATLRFRQATFCQRGATSMGSSKDSLPQQRAAKQFELLHMLPGEEPGTLVLLGRCVRTGELFLERASIRRCAAVTVP